MGLPLGTRAIQLPDTRVRSFLLDTFGRPVRQVTCECERTVQPNIAQALHLLNGDFLNKKIEDPTGRVEELLKKKTPTPALIEELYLVTLGRPPLPEEINGGGLDRVGAVAKGRDARPALGAAEPPRVPVQSLNDRDNSAFADGCSGCRLATLRRSVPVAARRPLPASEDSSCELLRNGSSSALVFSVSLRLCGSIPPPVPPSRPTGRTSAPSCASTAPPATTPRT